MALHRWIFRCFALQMLVFSCLRNHSTQSSLFWSLMICPRFILLWCSRIILQVNTWTLRKLHPLQKRTSHFAMGHRSSLLWRSVNHIIIHHKNKLFFDLAALGKVNRKIKACPTGPLLLVPIGFVSGLLDPLPTVHSQSGDCKGGQDHDRAPHKMRRGSSGSRPQGFPGERVSVKGCRGCHRLGHRFHGNRWDDAWVSRSWRQGPRSCFGKSDLCSLVRPLQWGVWIALFWPVCHRDWSVVSCLIPLPIPTLTSIYNLPRLLT